MTRRLLIIAFVAVVILGGIGLYAVFRTPEAASGPIEAVPLGTPQAQAPQPTESEPPTAVVEASATPEPATDPSAGEGPTLYEIIPAESQARFVINEVLNGAPKTVVGTTDQVSGQIALDMADPGATQVGTILVNARTLVTDNDFRNRALANQILRTAQFEFVTFVPTEVLGLPESVEVGTAYSFQIMGDLTVRDISREVTFDATVTPAADDTLQGIATATIQYADYSIVIPEARSVTSVEDEVILEIEFVARAQGA
jgi:polyisoprenoid-binding protein YceI